MARSISAVKACCYRERQPSSVGCRWSVRRGNAGGYALLMLVGKPPVMASSARILPNGGLPGHRQRAPDGGHAFDIPPRCRSPAGQFARVGQQRPDTILGAHEAIGPPRNWSGRDGRPRVNPSRSSRKVSTITPMLSMPVMKESRNDCLLAPCAKAAALPRVAAVSIAAEGNRFCPPPRP